MTKTERQKLLDHIDSKKNTITASEAFNDISEILEQYIFEPTDAYTRYQIQYAINIYFTKWEEQSVRIYCESHDCFIVGGIARFIGDFTIKIDWVRPDGTLIT